MRSTRFKRSCFLGITAMLGSQFAMAGPSWDGGGANNLWSTPGNWNDNTLPLNNGSEDLVFQSIIGQTLNMDSNWSVRSVRFNPTASFTLGTTSNAGLALGVGGVTNASSSLQTVDTAITSALGFSIHAENGALSFLRRINVGVFDLNVFGAHAVNLSGVIEGTGELNKTGLGTLTIGGDAANTRVGFTRANSGTLILNKTTGAALAGGTIIVGASPTPAALILNRSSQFGGTTTLDIRSNGTVQGNNEFNLITHIIFTGGSIQQPNIRTLGSITSNAAANSAVIGEGTLDFFGEARTFNVADGAAAIDLDVAANINANGGVLKTGAGVMRLSGENFGTLGTSVQNGTLILDRATGPVINGRTITVGGGLTPATLVINRSGQFAGTSTLDVRANGSVAGNEHFSLVAHILLSGGFIQQPFIRSLGSITSNAAATSAVIGAGTLDFFGEARTFNVADGAAAIDLDVAASINSNGGVIKTGTGALRLSGANVGTLGTNVQSGTVLLASPSAAGASLSVGASANAVAAAGLPTALRVKALAINTTGKLNLTDNDMIIDYTGASPLGTIRGYIGTGRNGGNWLGNGLTSSIAVLDPRTALGLVEATQLGSPATFFGQPIDNTTLLTRYTLYGDGNLDGTVNISDFAFLAANFNVATNSWFLGDYNYDGSTNISDFALLASNFNLSLPTDLPRGGAVPEPGALAIFGAAAVALQCRCRRNRA